MDLQQLSQLPLSVLVILGAYWAIQRNDTAYQAKLIELIGQFTEKYIDLYNSQKEDREESSLRWLERDRALVALIIDVKDTVNRQYGEVREAMQNNAQQTHNLRSTLTPLVNWWSIERAKQERLKGGSGGPADATG